MPVGRAAPDVLPDDPVLVDKWRRLIDRKQCSRKEFMETYKVVRKKSGMFGDTLVPFVERPAQTEQRESIELQWRSDTGARVIGLKGRQEGWSTSAALEMWECFVRGGGGLANIFSYDDDAVRELFRMFLSFVQQTPKWVFTCLLRGGGTWLKRSAKQLEIAFEDGNQNAMLQCLTAGDKNSGSGSAPRWLLWDEFTKWKDEAKADSTSMSEGWQSGPGNLWIIQFTGQGMEKGQELFMDAFSGTSESGFVALFHPWIGHPDRSEKIPPRKYDSFMASIGKIREFGPKDETALVAAGATPEELFWRRQKVAGPGFAYNLDLFRREYPLVASDAFTANTRTVFHGQEEVLKTHAAPAKDRERAAKVGEFRFLYEGRGDGAERAINGVVFDEFPGGPWVIFEPPDPDLTYTFGVDATGGKSRKNEKFSEADFAVAMFDELYTGRTVARYRLHQEGTKLGKEVFLAALYFGGARGLVENNSYGTAVINAILGMEHKDWSGADLLMTTPSSANVTQVGGQPGEQIGIYKNNEVTEELINVTRDWLEEVGVWTAGKPTPMCSMFNAEALLFQRNLKTNKPEASKGHDDCVIAKAIALYAKKRRADTGDWPEPTKLRKAKPTDPYQLWLLEQYEASKRSKRVRAYLGGAF